MIIAIGGPPGSGKTTVAEHFANAHGYVLVSAGMMFRQMAQAHGADLSEFSREAEHDHTIDRELDRRVLEEIMRQDAFGSDVIVDGRIQAYLLAQRKIPCLKAWIDAPFEIRAGRIADREGKPVEVARKEIADREASERTRYRAIYGIDLSDTTVFDLVIDSSDKTPDEIVSLVWSRVAG